MGRKMLSIILTVTMVASIIGIMPVTTYAADNPKNLYDAAVLPNGNIAILYISSGEICFGVLDPNTNNWNNSKIAEGKDVAFDLDASGHPHIAYISNDDNLGYIYYDGSSWSSPEIIDSIAFNGVDGPLTTPDIAIDANGKAHISYLDAKGGYTGGNDYSSYDSADLVYANNTSGSFAKTVRYYGHGYYYYTGWGYQGEYWHPLAPPKIIITDSDYTIGIKHHYFWRDPDPKWSSHTYSYKLLSTDPANDLTYPFGASDILFGMDSNGNSVYSLIKKANTLYVTNGITETTAATKAFAATGANLFVTDNNTVYYSGILTNTLLLYQNGDFKENITLPGSINTTYSRVSTLVYSDKQYVLYTDTSGNLWVCHVSTAVGDTVLNSFKIPDKLPVTIDGVTVDNKEYDGEPVTPGGNLTITGGNLTAEDLLYTYTSTDGAGYSSTTPPTNVGDYKLVISIPEENQSYTGSSSDIPFSITPKNLSVIGTTAIDRDYEADNMVVALNTENSSLSGVIAIDEGNVTLDKSGAGGIIAYANATQSKAVTVTGFALTGSAAANYTLSQPTGITVNINPITLNAPTVALIADSINGGLSLTVSDLTNSAGVGSYSVEIYQGTDLKKTITGIAKDVSQNIPLETNVIVAELPYTAKAVAIADASGNYSDSAVGNPSASASAAYNPLIFSDSPDYDIPASNVDIPIAAIDVSIGVTGGKLPYSFSTDNLPSWASINSSGMISGTPSSVASEGTATITVTDAQGHNQNITISYGAVAKGNPLAFQGVLPPAEKTYGDEPVMLELTYDGQASNVAYTVLSGPGNIDGNTLTFTGAGDITLRASGTSANYADKVQDYTISVSRKPIIINPIAKNNTKVYGETDPLLAYSNSLLVGVDTLSGTILERAPGENAGTYTISIAADAATNNPNYLLSLAPGPHYFAITPKPISVTGATIISKPYDGTVDITASSVTAITLNGDIDGLLLGIDLEILTATYTDNTFAGTSKPTRITVGPKDTTKASNYKFEADANVYSGATAEVTAANQVITASDQSLAVTNTLDLSDISSSNAPGAILTYSIEGGTSDYASLSGSILTATSEGVVTININSAGVDVGGTSDNEYSSAVQKQITITVSAKENGDDTITFNDGTLIYGDNYIPNPTTTLTDGAWSYNYSGTALDGESYSDSVPPYKAGSYVVTAKYENSSHIGTKSANLTIAPKPITISVTATDRPYDGTTSVNITGGILEGLINDDVATANIPTTGTVENANVGSNKGVLLSEITLSGADKDNYILTQPGDIRVNILPKEMTFAIEPIANQDYTGSQITPNPIVKDGSITLIHNTDYTISYGSNVNAGLNQGSVIITGIGNYEGSTGNADFTINKVSYSGAAVTGTKQVLADTVALGVTYDLSELLFPSGFVGISYGPVTLVDNEDGLITDYLPISGNTLTFDVASLEAGNAAIFNVVVSSTNFNDHQVAITVNTVNARRQSSGSSYTPPTITVATEETITSTTNKTEISPVLSSGTATATVSASVLDALLEKANQTKATGKEDKIEIIINTQKDTEGLRINIQQKDLMKIVNDTDVSLAITSPFASINFDGKALETIDAADSGGNVVVSASVIANELLSEAEQTKVNGRPVYSLTVMNGNKQISDFGGGQATITIPYELKTGENPNAVIIYHLTDGGTIKGIRGHYDANLKGVIFKTPHFSRFVINHNPVSFDDVLTGAWYKNAVDFNASRGITSGTGNNKFSPDAKLTRGQFVVLIMKAYQLNTQNQGQMNQLQNFADAVNAYYTDYLLAAKDLGIVNGIGNNLFAPEKEITRQEMLVMLYNALNVIDEVPAATLNKQLSDFSDSDQVATWASEAVSSLIKAGIINGNNNNLNPTLSTTRAEIAQVLYNLLKK